MGVRTCNGLCSKHSFRTHPDAAGHVQGGAETNSQRLSERPGASNCGSREVGPKEQQQEKIDHHRSEGMARWQAWWEEGILQGAVEGEEGQGNSDDSVLQGSGTQLLHSMP